MGIYGINNIIELGLNGNRAAAITSLLWLYAIYPSGKETAKSQGDYTDEKYAYLIPRLEKVAA